MNEPNTEELWEELAQVAESNSPEQLDAFLDRLPTGDVALAVSRLSEEGQNRVLTVLSPSDAADLIEQLPNVQAVALIEQMEPEAAAAIIDELPSDKQADLLGDLPKENAEAILQVMQPEEAADARVLSRYADEVAGGLMVTEYLHYPQHYTVGDVVEDMRDHAPQYRDYDIQYAYVCDDDGRLAGVLRLRDLLLADHAQMLQDIMIREPVSVPDHTSLDDLVSFFNRYHFLGVPVVDSKGKLLGVVRKAAVDEAKGERQDSDFLKTQGLVGEEIRTMPVWLRSRRRLAWLSVNILLNVIAASVIAFYQDTLAAVIALAVFLPIISDMSGCSGNQAVAVSLRELTLGFIRPHEVLRVWWKEVSVGLVNGAALGLLIALVAATWQGNIFLGLVVGVALCLNTMVAVSLGGIVPLLLRQFNMDPAIASGPILTTVTDMCGFFFVLGFASMMLPYLT